MDRGPAPQGLQNSAQGFNPGNPQNGIRPHKALPSSALLEKHPVRRVGGAEGAIGCQTNFASVVAENESVQLRDATIVTLERSDPTSALLIFDEPIETRRPDSDQ
ncbi:MAG: hypothetical protein QOE88_229 [Verrucomicrobiota bacterium]|nr:hypothetical protein [Verrucomicrobiota bacterium]